MSSYPPISTTIDHNPRPSTDVLRVANESISMSTSPSLYPQTELEPPQNIISNPDLQNDLVEYPQFMLFGDSITQFGTLTLQAYLQTQYIRRLDVINRGLSGFTAPMGFRALQRFLPLHADAASWPRVKLITVFFGANDACVPGESQHVELQSYVDALKAVIQYPVFQQQGPRKTHLIIITPPPINEHQFQQAPNGPFQRRAGTTSQYARAAAQAGRAYGAHVLDLWSILMQKVGWHSSMGRDCCCKHISCHLESRSRPADSDVQHIPGCSRIPPTNPKAEYELSDFLTDGLHLTKLGYDVLFWELMNLIRRDVPECAPESLPFVLPEWRIALNMI